MSKFALAPVESRVAAPSGPAGAISTRSSVEQISRSHGEAATEAQRRTADARREISFGRYRLLPAQHLLLAGDSPVHLGSRAFDLLLALVERPGALRSKDELMAKVWPHVFVDEGNLKVQIAALRRALGDGSGSERYIAAVPGRGYCFVMPVTRSPAPRPATPDPAATARLDNLPAALTPLIGRDEVIRTIALQSSQQRLLSVVGPGGIGKTSLALDVARDLVGTFEHGVWFVDLAKIGNPLFVPHALAAAIGLEICGEEPLATLLVRLDAKNMLFVLDNCEHVIDGTAQVALALLRTDPGIHVLATSREPLRIEGERVHRLAALEWPSMSPSLGAAEALQFPAVQLFVERATGTLGEFVLRDEDVPFVIEICRKLDGIPLAIEAAAADIEAFGVAGVAARLDDPLQLPTMRRRGAAARQRTLGATAHWSYRLLQHSEQALLQRLAGFADSFTAADAMQAAADDARPENEMARQLAALVAKSLLTPIRDEWQPRFRMTAVMRAYALGRLAADEKNGVTRHSSAPPRPEGVVHQLRLCSRT